MKLEREYPFEQKWDIIIDKTRPLLDIEKAAGKQGDFVSLFLNSTTGVVSSNIEDVIREDVPYVQTCFSDDGVHSKSAFTAEYVEDLGIVFHMLYKPEVGTLSKGSTSVYKEYARFIVRKEDYHYLTKQGGEYSDARSNSYINVNKERGIQNLKNDCNYRADDVPPYSIHAFSCTAGDFVNMETGEVGKGLGKVLSNMFPVMYNNTGNDYLPITSYENLVGYLKADVKNTKKTGKKQELIDKLVSYALPEVNTPILSEEDRQIYKTEDNYKFAVIQRVEDAEEPTCVVRTLNYILSEDIIFEGGRIYITKKNVEFCKKNNNGEFVPQPLLSKINHWDFSIEKFNREETIGTKLEYFGEIVEKIDDYNRAIAIWMFLKEPLLEQIAKATSDDMVNYIIENLRMTEEIPSTLQHLFGVNYSNGTKMLQILGVNSAQLKVIKEVMPTIPQKDFFTKEYREREKYNIVMGIVPFVKQLLTGGIYENISSIDINTFNEYFDFATQLFSYFEKFSGKETAECIENILDMCDKSKQVYPQYDIKNHFPLFLKMFISMLKGYSSHRNYQYRNKFNDTLRMMDMVDETKTEYKPKFSSLEELENYHDNMTTLIQTINMSDYEVRKFEERNKNVWTKWEYFVPDKKDKDGKIIEKGLPFMVIAPKNPTELAAEGTKLHHCVSSYIKRVAEGSTNIVFIRKVEEPDVPFFTVEIDNDNIIQQVHGFGNRNANTEPNMEEFVALWAKKHKLRTLDYNKVR